MRYKQLRDYANQHNVHVQRVRHLRDRFNPLEEYDDEDFRLHFGLSKDSVSDLAKILDEDLQHQTRRGLPLTPMQQVLIALRFYATGTFQRVIGDLFGVSVFAACKVIHKVSRTIAKLKRRFLSIPENLADGKRNFYDIGHFPGVIGAIDCTHIRIIYPNKENAMAFVNRKQFFFFFFFFLILFAHLHIYFTKLHYHTTYITILKLHTTYILAVLVVYNVYTLFLLPTLQETNKQNKTNTEINMYH